MWKVTSEGRERGKREKRRLIRGKEKEGEKTSEGRQGGGRLTKTKIRMTSSRRDIKRTRRRKESEGRGE